MKEPIAIIGMSCRFPKASNTQAFWQLLINGVDAIDDIPPDRFDAETYHSPVPKAPGKIASRQGGFLDRIDMFDAMFFGIPPREAVAVDPQQRLLLETAWEALEDAGQVPERLSGSKTGVFIGMWTNDYEDRMYAASENVNLYTTTGGGRYAASGRLSYLFNLHGPSLTVDTACSSSLVAAHLAIQSLWNGESTMALVGGVNLILIPQISIGYSRSGMLSVDGRCKFGDASANGYVRSEGAGVVVLKPLSQAIADGDPVHAVIRGSAVNNDGRSSELLVAPSPETQAFMLQEAYRSAGVNPADVHYVEAHGTGTRVGDPVELTALGRVLGEGRSADQPCLVGSVKTNIGHTEAASGIAGLIKAVLCLKHRVIPPSLHLRQPSPNIPWGELPLVIPQTLTAWPQTAGPAYAGVNSFGVTGTNAHLVLEEAPPDERQQPTREAEGLPLLLPISAKTEDALADLARDYQAVVQQASLRDLCYSASTRRSHHEQRLAVIASTNDEMAQQLRAFLDGEAPRGVVATKNSLPQHRVAFVFPGQGGQWMGMGRQLLAQEPVFRQTLEACAAAMQPYVSWNLLDVLQSGQKLDEIDMIQPALFAVQVALAALWRSWGVEPDAIIGHSMGEVAGAYVAGILSLDAAAQIICQRSQLMRRVSGQGAMAVVELSFEEAQAAIAGYEDQLGIAVSNGPRSSVLSGDPAALQAVVETLQAQDVFCRPVKVDVAAHSPHMDTLRPELVRGLGGLQAQAAQVAVYSTVTGEQHPGTEFHADYWGANLRQPVRFAAAVQQALADGYNVFLEISPHPVLLAAVEQGVQFAQVADTLTVASTRREEDERAGMLEGLGRLYAAGYNVDWKRVYPAGRVLRLPTYRWQRERFWFDESGAQNGLRRGGVGHPLLGQHFRSHSGTHYWEVEFDLAALPYLADHRVQGRVILPAAAYVEVMLAAAHEAFGQQVCLERVTIAEALFLSESAPQMMQVIVEQTMPGTARVQCFSRAAGDDQNWVLNAFGTIRAEAASPDQPQAETPHALRARLSEAVSGETHYQRMEGRRLNYGAAFQGVTGFWQHGGDLLAEIRLPEQVESSGYHAHPALLDAAFQTLLETEQENVHDTYMPVSLSRVQQVAQPAEGRLWAYVQRQPEATGDLLAGDILLLDAGGQVVMSIEGLRMQRLERSGDVLADWLYQVEWEALEPLPEAAAATLPRQWLIFADSRGYAEALAARLRALGAAAALVRPGDGYARLDAAYYQVNPASPDDFRRLLAELASGGSYAVAHLWALDIADDTQPAALHQAEMLGTISALHLTQALAALPAPPQLWLVSRGAFALPGSEAANPMQAPLWGLGATIANEHPELNLTLIDLDGGLAPDDAANHISRAAAFTGRSLDALHFAGEQAYQRRLRPYSAEAAASADQFVEVSPAQQPLRAEVQTPGVLDNLALRPLKRQRPQAGQVEVEVYATGLNFMNVMSALGVCPGYPRGVGPLGIECAGRISGVGEGVSGWQVGDEVVAYAFDCLGTHAVTDARLIARKPAHLTFEEAATIPIVFLTVHYALNVLARMSAGDKVLIHAAAGGVGMAAIQLARRAGAEVWATAGTPEKRQMLREWGIEHVFDSRSLAFADDILAATNGEGVDIVLNSLAGEAITKGLEILRPYGRFLEIGKRDIYENSHVGLLPFQKNLSYFAIDLDRMARERPALVGDMLGEVMALLEAGEIQPLPLTVFPLSQMADAFRYMAQGKHTGKVVISAKEDSVLIPAGEKPLVYSDASYLITGGLGGLGLAVARWLAEQGAGQLVLVGRRKPSDAAYAVIEALEAAGTQVYVTQADVSQFEAVADLVAHIEQNLFPLKGVFHAAGLLNDSLMMQMQAEQFQQVTRPKVDGALNLHSATQHHDLDFFVLFSSVMALLGAPGQANYAAANAFLDALALHRQAHGQAALSINWGPWSEVGLAAAQDNRGSRLAQRGLGSITPEQGIHVLERLMKTPAAQVAVMPFDAAQWARTYRAAGQSSLLAELLQAESAPAAEQPTAAKADFKAALLAAEAGREARALLENHIREQVAQVLGLAVKRVDIHKPLRNMGIDSLMTLELRNRLEASLKLTLPATLVFNYPTIVEMAAHLAEKLGVGETSTHPSGVLPEAQPQAVDELEQLSQAEVEALLAEELNSLDELLKGN